MVELKQEIKDEINKEVENLKEQVNKNLEENLETFADELKEYIDTNKETTTRDDTYVEFYEGSNLKVDKQKKELTVSSDPLKFLANCITLVCNVENCYRRNVGGGKGNLLFNLIFNFLNLI